MANDFLSNYREAVGVVYGPLGEFSPHVSPFKATPPSGVVINWKAQNKGVDSASKEQTWTETPERIVTEDKGVKPLQVVPESSDSPIVVPKKVLWRLDGRNADESQYNALLDSVKGELSKSQNYDETAKILKKYAKNWMMNMYLLGTEEGRESGFYDWSPANFFAEELDVYKERNKSPGTSHELSNQQWVEELIDSIDNSLRIKEKIYMPSRKATLV